MLIVKEKGKIPSRKIETDAPYIDIWLAFDVHNWSKEQLDVMYDEYCKWSTGENRYVIWGGDDSEFAVPTIDKFKYMAGQNQQPDKQWQDYETRLRIYAAAGKMLIVLVGNHEVGRIINYSFAYDPFEKLTGELGIPYSRVNTYFNLKVNDRDYLFYLSHGRSGAQTEDYILKQHIIKGIGNSADFIVVGHSHHNFARSFYHNFIKDGIEYVREIVGLRPGSFLVEPEYVGMDRPRPQPDGNMILRLYANNSDYGD